MRLIRAKPVLSDQERHDMPAVKTKIVSPVDLPATWKSLKAEGYRKGTIEAIPRSDLIKLRVWRTQQPKQRQPKKAKQRPEPIEM